MIWVYNNYNLGDVMNSASQVSEAAAQGRLRRICEMKPSQKLNCPEWMHQQWKTPSNRPAMIEHLQQVNWNKDRVSLFVSAHCWHVFYKI